MAKRDAEFRQHKRFARVWLKVHRQGGSMEDVANLLGIDLLSVYRRKREYELYRARHVIKVPERVNQ